MSMQNFIETRIFKQLDGKYSVIGVYQSYPYEIRVELDCNLDETTAEAVALFVTKHNTRFDFSKFPEIGRQTIR